MLPLLVRQFRRLDLAEEGLADAYAAAAERWQVDGPPAVPAAWLLTAARRRILDRLRREAVLARKVPQLALDAVTTAAEAADAAADGTEPEDDQLRLIFVCAHPVLSPESATALTLRLDRVLAVAYLAFTAAYAPPSGSVVVRPDLAAEAIRLTRLLRAQLPGPEVDALLALMLLQHARRDARVDAAGAPVLLPYQDRTRWRGDEIAEGLALLERLSTAEESALLGRYLLQARIAAEHARARTAAATRWDRIAALYGDLERLTASPVVRLNRAVAVAEAEGAAAGLDLLRGLEDALRDDYRVPGIRARLLALSGRPDEARAGYDEALARCRNEPAAAELRRQRDELPLG